MNPIETAIQAQRRRAVVENIRGLMAEALGYRLGGPDPENTEAVAYVGMSMLEMAQSLLQLRGVSYDGRQQLLDRAIVEGDVPALLTGAGNRVLRQAFQAYSDGLLRVARRRRVRDFRDVKSVMVDGDATLMPLGENGEIQAGLLKAGAESFVISTFGRILAISRKLLLDDDLGGIQDLTERLGRMAAEFVSAKLAALLEANAAMSDTVAVFHATHANLGTTGVLSETTLGELVKLVRAQKGLSNEPIANAPRALVVPSALEFAARKLVWLLGSPPPFEVLVEPRLTSATAFYLFSTGDGIEYARPDGEGPSFEVGRRPGFTGLQSKVVLHFGAGVVDFRGIGKNVGA